MIVEEAGNKILPVSLNYLHISANFTYVEIFP